MATNDTLNDSKKVPAPLRLPAGKLFFGYPVVPYKGKEVDKDDDSAPSVPSAPPATPAAVRARFIFSYAIRLIDLPTPASASFVCRKREHTFRPSTTFYCADTVNGQFSTRVRRFLCAWGILGGRANARRRPCI